MSGRLLTISRAIITAGLQATPPAQLPDMGKIPPKVRGMSFGQTRGQKAVDKMSHFLIDISIFLSLKKENKTKVKYQHLCEKMQLIPLPE